MGWAGAAIGLGTSLLGGIMGSKKSAQEKAADKLAEDMAKKQQEMAGKQLEMMDRNLGWGDDARKLSSQQWAGAQGNFQKAGGIYDRLNQFYTATAQNPYAMAAPQLSQISRNAYQQEQAMRGEMPRGGGAALAMAQNRLNMGAQAADAVANARNGAYSALAGIGQAYGQQGGVYGQLAGQNAGLAQGYGQMAGNNISAASQSYQAAMPPNYDPYRSGQASRNMWGQVAQLGGGILGGYMQRKGWLPSATQTPAASPYAPLTGTPMTR